MMLLGNKKQDGFTIIELIISMGIGLIVLSALVNIFLLERRVFDAQEQKLEALQTARAAVNMISQEVMMAGYNPSHYSYLQKGNDNLDTFTGVVYDASKSELEVRADLNGDGIIVTDATGSDPDNWSYDENERIVYRVNSEQIQRKTGGGVFQPFADNIKTFDFNYLKANGTVATSEADIRNIEIIIEVETDKPEIGGGFKTNRLQTIVVIRNLGIAS